MNTLRSLVMLAILGAVGFGVYATLNQRPIADPPEGLPADWDLNPDVQLGDISGPPSIDVPTSQGLQPNSSGPVRQMAAPSGDAPPFAPPASAQTQSASEAPAFSPPPMSSPPATSQPQSDYGMASAGSSFEPPMRGDSPSGYAEGYADPSLAAANAQIEPPAAEAAWGSPGSLSSVPETDLAPSGSGKHSGETPSHGGFADPTARPPMAPASEHELPSAALQPAGEATPWGTDEPTASSTTPVMDFGGSWGFVQQSLQQDRLVDALRELSRWYGSNQLNPQEREQVQQLLDQLAGTVIYSRESLLEPAYEVQPGDTLERIASYYSIPWQLLAKINGVTDPESVHSGEQLKVVRGPFAADVSLHEFRLTLWLGDLYAGTFPIGIGADYSRTPEGEFEVQQKLENPTYYGPDEVIDANDPRNPLGEYWISLGNHLGIHGTIEAQSIGKAESRGCIRLSERDISDVYDMLTPGSRVRIRR